MSATDYLATFDLVPGYLNWAAFGPISTTVRDEAIRGLEMLGSGYPTSVPTMFEYEGRARELLAELLRADAADVTLHNSSTHGLMQAFYGLTGDVLVSTAEFPAVSLTLHRAAQSRGTALTPRWITPADGRVTPDVIAAALDEDVTAVTVSHVDFRTGYRIDLAALRDAIGPDRLLVLDAVQSFGVVDDDYALADVVVGHGYKWVRAGRGTGFARFNARARERIAPVLSGTTGTTVDGLFVDSLPDPAASGQAYGVSKPDPLAAARLAAGLRDVRDIGVAEIEKLLAKRVDAVIEIADRAGVPVASPRERAQRAGIVVLAPADPARLAQALADAGVTATARGETVRVAPHAGTDDETLRMLEGALMASDHAPFTIS
ncbi:aminotransferase class V-fold PLP-dependent enzyme [Microbacterium sp. H1-D42]|uniref:aminotransferase class V-fold PLP-dependent enzyme n=1 Tax=Microbacterium sp. H1-D42 TaxID=2925844 RepID=UPI001F5323E7|nr:aminotransferase class V-fold PLP-dependent enzyme [Microbacterium sp. H1-D42]UNK69878.1 aminotransferase class V-fold PLP-dependent enzyme [Microbacterium sp. H1-D42]